jgi:MFS family permease
MLTLLRQRNFALLWWGGLISMMGDWMLMVGLPIYVFQLSNSTLATGLVLIANVLPRIFLGSLAGVLVDRWNRQWTMVVANVLLGLGLLPLLLVESAAQLWIVYLVAFAQSVIRQFFGPAEGALLPTLVGEGELLHANALNAMNNNLARLLGPPLGGFAAAWFGLSAIALADALTFIVAAALIALIQLAPKSADTIAEDAPHKPPAHWRTLGQEWRTGLQIIGADPLLKHLFLWSAITAVGEGVMGVLMVPFVERVLHGDAITLGWMMGAQAVGGILGGFLVASVKQRFPLPALVGSNSIALGLCDFLLFNYPAFTLAIWPALLIFVLAGFPVVWLVSALQTLMQQATHDQYRGRILGAYGTTLALFGLVGMGCASYLGDVLGVRLVIQVQAAAYLLGGALFLWLTRRGTAQIGSLPKSPPSPQLATPAAD